MSSYGINLSLMILLVVLIFFFEICGHIVYGHVPPSVSHLLVALQLLALEKQPRGVWPITIREVIYQLIIGEFGALRLLM